MMQNFPSKKIYDANLEPKFQDKVVVNLIGISGGKKLDCDLTKLINKDNK